MKKTKSILLILIGALLIACIVLIFLPKGPKEQKKGKITETSTVTEKTTEKETKPAVVIYGDYIQGDAYNQKTRTTKVQTPAKEVKPVKKAEVVKKAKVVKQEKTEEVEAVTKEEKSDEIKGLEARVTENEQKIWLLQTQAKIRSREDLEKANTQIAELTAQLAELRAEIRYLESQMYAQQEPQVEVVEHHYYHDYWNYWPCFSPFIRVVSIGMCPWVPMGGIWSWTGWYDWYYQYHYPYGARSPGYYGSGYYGQHAEQTTASKNQLRNPRTRTTLSASQLRSSVKTATSAKLSRVSKRGVRIDPIYTLPRSQRPIKKVNSTSRKPIYGKSLLRRTPSRSLFSKAHSKSSRSLRSSHGSTRTSRITKTKVRKK